MGGDYSGDMYVNGVVRANQLVSSPGGFSFGGPESDTNFPTIATVEVFAADPTIVGQNRAVGSLAIAPNSVTGFIGLFQKISNGGGLPTDWAVIAGGGGGGGSVLPATFPDFASGDDFAIGSFGQVNAGTGGAGLQLAIADGTQNPPLPLGLAQTAISDSALGNWVNGGPMTFSGGQINALTGSPTLVVGAQYFLSDTIPGGWTTPAPTDTGTWAVPIGVAHTTHILFVQIGQPVGPL